MTGSKPLELEVGELKANRHGMWYRMTSGKLIGLGVADRRMLDKRLSDSDLSAEFWRLAEEATWGELMMTEWAEDRNAKAQCMVDRWFARRRTAQRQAETVRRFASHPHHDET